jgi:hypothetical protein
MLKIPVDIPLVHKKIAAAVGGATETKGRKGGGVLVIGFWFLLHERRFQGYFINMTDRISMSLYRNLETRG